MPIVHKETIVPEMEIKQPNVITEARFDFTQVQLDVYFYLLALFKDTHADDVSYEIPVQDMTRLTGREWNYQYLKEATRDLLLKIVEFHDEEGHFNQSAMISSAKYLKGQGKVRLSVSPVIRPVLAQLKREYTSFQLYCALAMTSKYAKRIYMVCSRWKNNIKTGGIAYSKPYTLDELKYMLELKDPKGKRPEQLTRWYDFKLNVLDTAVAQINKYTDIKISYNSERVGRKIGVIQFRVEKGNQHQLLIDFSDDGVDTTRFDLKNRLVAIYGLSEKQATEVARRIDNEAIKELLVRVDEAKKLGKIKGAVGGYTVSSIQNEWGILK